MKRLKLFSAAAAFAVLLSGTSAFSRVLPQRAAAYETVQDGALTFEKHVRDAALLQCDPSAEAAVIPREIDGLPVTQIMEEACYQCAALTEVVIPDTVESIGYRAFEGCTGLTALTVPDSVTVIGDFAFYGCSGLTSAFIGSGAVTIRGSAFAECTALKQIRLPDALKTISNNLFYGCISLENIKLPNSLGTIGMYAFSGCSSLTDMVIPRNTDTIRISAFNGCTNLETVIIPESVTEIGGAAFKDCDKLTVKCAEGSAAYQYAVERRIPVEIIDFSQFVPSGLFGDVNGDGKISAEDASLALTGFTERAVLGLDADKRTLTPEQETIGDVDLDGGLMASDASYILTYFTMIISGFDNVTWYGIIGNPDLPDAP